MSAHDTAVRDRSLVDRILATGEERAFRALYRRHTPAIYQFALRSLGGHEAEAEDVVQEMWIRATEHLADFRWESTLRSWLTGIALNLCRGLFRRRDRNWLSLEEELVPTAPPTHPESRLDLETALTALPDGFRAVLVLHDVEGFTHEEIADQLGIAAGTSKSQLFRARRAMRRLLEPAGQTR